MLYFAILLLFSLAILNVDAKLKSDHNISNSSQRANFGDFLIAHVLNNNMTSLSEDLQSEPTPHIQKKRGKLFSIDCSNLKIGQFYCPQAEIDLETQQPKGCSIHNLAPINCTLRDGLICDDDNEVHPSGANDVPKRYVQLAVACEYTNGYSYEITLLLSIFLGMFGADRFYLGYPAIGLLKMSTLGFLFLGQFIDIILIAMQIVKPADGSNYIIKQFGPKLSIVKAPGVYGMVSPILNANFVTESAFDVYFYLPNNFTTT